MSVPSNLGDITNKVRRITGRPSVNQITDQQIWDYINTYYIYDLPEELQLISNRVNFQFITNANTAIYDMPDDIYLGAMPPVFIGGYQSFMTQSRDKFYRINPQLNYLQQGAAKGTNATGPYTLQLMQTPIMRGWKTNPPGAYSTSVFGTQSDIPANQLSWMVLISGTDAAGNSVSLIDDGQGNLFDFSDASTDPITTATITGTRGNIDYNTGVATVFGPLNAFGNPTGFIRPIATGAMINAQYVPYVASRPQSCVYYQDQINLYPIPDQAYTVSFEAYRLPTALINASNDPKLKQWWQVLAYGAADKIFTDNADMENMAKFRPLLQEQLKLIQRRTIVQQTSERTSSIYEDQNPLGQFPFGNCFSGF